MTADFQDGSKPHILVVDDDPELLGLIADTLRDFGFCVTAFVDSHKALQAFLSAPGDFNVVISDNYMPGIRGTELLGAIRNIRHDVPLMLISGDYDHPARLRIPDLEILAKPFDDRELIEQVRRLLDRQHQPVGLKLPQPDIEHHP